MEQLTPAETLNRNNKNRLVDQFYVSFMKLPENVSNLLGRQTQRIERPTIQFEYSQQHHRRNRFNDLHQLRFDPITLTLFDDENGMTSQAIYTQVYRQINEGKDVFGRWPELDRDYRFDVKMELYNSIGKQVEGYILKDCFIAQVTHTEMQTTDPDQQTEINVTLVFDNIEFFIVDSYVAARPAP